MNYMSTPVSQPSPLHLITLGACLDAQAEHLLESAVYRAQEAQGRHILLNLQALTTIDSRGLGKLFLTYHHLNRQNIRLSMVNPSPMVREMLEFVNFPTLVKIYNSLDEIVGQDLEIIFPHGLHSSALS
jgi:anti-anti-sigma factor